VKGSDVDNIPGELLHAAVQHGTAGRYLDVLHIVANAHTERAAKLRAQRTRGWKSASDELDTVAAHINAFSDALVGHVELYGADGNRLPAESPTFNGTDLETPPGKVTPAPLPGNTGRCASFRRATPGDPMVCTLERGHDGSHAAPGDDPAADWASWPRQHSGAVCGDVVILPDGTALNCALPLGHDGDEHYDGRFRLWPRGVGTSRYVRTCQQCNTDTHACPGCGEPLGHFVQCCEGCAASAADAAPVAICANSGAADTVVTDGAHVISATIGPDAAEPGTVPPCGDREPTMHVDATSCMLPTGHTGKHIGHTGARWERGGPTLAEQTSAAAAALTIPAPRESAETEPAMTPAAVLVAETKEQVTAAVSSLTGDEPIGTPFPPLANPFSPVVQTVGIGPGPAMGGLSNPFAVPAPPPEPKALLLPPHLVPGTPKPHQSVSSIQMMSECALRYRLHYRDGITGGVVGWWNVGGTAFHQTVEHIERAHAESGGSLYSTTAPVFEVESDAGAIWREMFLTQIERTHSDTDKHPTTWRAAKGGKENRAWWEASGEDMVRRYVHHRIDFLKHWRLLTTPAGALAQEVEFFTPIEPGAVPLKGFIDSAWISTDGTTIRVEDYKSGSSAGDVFQLKTYGAVLRAMGADGGEGDRRRIVGAFYEARNGKPTPDLELTAADDVEVSYRANTAAMMDAAGIFPANPSPGTCSTCSVSHACPVMAMKG
jgi:hypothetical protein